MPKMRTVMMQHQQHIEFVEMPESHAYQLSALNRRLHKEISKLTASNVPELPRVIAECEALEVLDPNCSVVNGLEYMNQLEASFSSIDEQSYPLIALLTEIRALQAQLEQWYEEEYEEA